MMFLLSLQFDIDSYGLIDYMVQIRAMFTKQQAYHYLIEDPSAHLLQQLAGKVKYIFLPVAVPMTRIVHVMTIASVACVPVGCKKFHTFPKSHDPNLLTNSLFKVVLVELQVKTKRYNVSV